MKQALPFEAVFTDISANGKRIPQSQYRVCGKYPIVDQGKLFIGGYTDDPTYRFESNHPVIVFGDHTKIIKFIDFPFCVGADGVKVLRAKIDAEPKYLYHFLNTVYIPDAGYSRHFKYLKRVDVPLPSITEQKRIAAILDEVNALCRKRREAITKLDSLLQSVFWDMFGNPISNPKSWPQYRLDELVVSGDSINYGVVQPGDENINGVPIVRVGDIVTGYIDTSNLKRISSEIEAVYKRSRLKGDEVLVSCVGSIGAVALATPSHKGFNIARAVARIPCGPKLDRTFLLYYLRTSHIQNYFHNETRTVSQPTLNIKQINETPVYCPPRSEQQKFADYVCIFEHLRASQQEAHHQANGLFASLQHQLFSSPLTTKTKSEIQPCLTLDF